MGAPIAGYTGAILLTSLPSVALAADFALVDSGDHTTFEVSTANNAYRYWDEATAMTFQTAPDGVTWTTVVPASIQYVGGKVTFPGAVSGATPSARVTAGNYLPWTVLANVTAWGFDGDVTFLDITSMLGDGNGGLQAGAGWKVFQPLLLEGSFTVTKFWVPESQAGFVADIDNRTLFIISGAEITGNRYEGFAYAKKASIKTDVEKVSEETLDFQLNGQFYCV